MKKRLTVVTLVIVIALISGVLYAQTIGAPADSDSFEAYLESLRQQRGYYVFTPDEVADFEEGYTYLAIFAGEKMTGGYELKVVSVKTDGDSLKITVKETGPAKGDAAITVITYPYAKLRIEGTFNSVEVVGKDGEAFELIKSEIMYGVGLEEELEEQGLYVGQIDSNFIEIIVDGQERSFALVEELKANFKGFEEGEKVNFYYYEHANGTLVITSIVSK